MWPTTLGSSLYCFQLSRATQRLNFAFHSVGRLLSTPIRFNQVCDWWQPLIPSSITLLKCSLISKVIVQSAPRRLCFSSGSSAGSCIAPLPPFYIVHLPCAMQHVLHNYFVTTSLLQQLESCPFGYNPLPSVRKLCRAKLLIEEWSSLHVLCFLLFY